MFEETKRTEGKHANTADAAKYLKLSDKEIGEAWKALSDEERENPMSPRQQQPKTTAMTPRITTRNWGRWPSP